MKNPITIYKMEIYNLNIDCLKSIDINNSYKYEKLNDANYRETLLLRNNSRSKEFKKNYRNNAICIVALDKNKVIGYGWLKFKNSYDYFVNIDSNIGFLASFFVHPDYRGENVYPSLLKKLILMGEEKYNIKTFKIAIQQNNLPSIKGSKKLGFQYDQKFILVRAFRMSIGKYKI